MFGIKSLCEEAENTLHTLEEHISNTSISTDDILALTRLHENCSTLLSRASHTYSHNGDWGGQGYLSAKTALVHETRRTKKTITHTLQQGELLYLHPSICDAARNKKITLDHVDLLIPISNSTYIDYFLDDVDLLVESASHVSASQFAHVVRHWKNMVDALLENDSDEYKAFQDRKLFLGELLDGSWFIHGTLDPITGKLLDKALRDISEKIWRLNENRSHYTPGQQRVDAMGYLAQGYISHEHTASVHQPDQSDSDNADHELSFTPASTLTADIIITPHDIASETTHNFLTQIASTPSPLVSTHSQKFIKQILCDSSVEIPIQLTSARTEFGRTARTAPLILKKQLMMHHSTCAIKGCTTPARWCDAHHLHHWADGGETNLDNMTLLCRRHHTMLHNDKHFEEKVLLSLHPG